MWYVTNGRLSRVRTAHAVPVAIILVAAGLAVPARAHEGHAALPSRGAKVEYGQLVLSTGAVDAIDMTEAKVVLADLDERLSVNARVVLPWYQQALVTTLVPGRIERVSVKPGDRVEPGAELARVASAELETIQSDMLLAAVDYDHAQRLIRQREPLAESGAIPGRRLLEARSELEQAGMRLEIARFKLLALGVDEATVDAIRESGEPVDSIAITSPIGGTVETLDVRPGQSVQTDEHLFHVVDTSRLLVAGSVLETDSRLVEVGQPAVMTVAALGGRRFEGTVEHVHLQIEEASRTVETMVAVDNLDGLLKPGMFGRMTITVARAEQTIACPTAALVEQQGRTYVLLRRGERKYERVPVRTGIRTRDLVQIEEGLFPGQRVIVVGTHVLAALFGTGAEEPNEEEEGNSQPSSPVPGRVVELRGHVRLPMRQDVHATSLIDGRIREIRVRHGQTVREGEVLAELESQSLKDLVLELLQAEERIAWTRRSIERIQPLANTGSVPERDLWELERDESRYAAQMKSVERRLGLLGLDEQQIASLHGNGDHELVRDAVQLGTVPIRAPSDGRLAAFDVVPGQVVRANSLLFAVRDLRSVWIEAHAFESDAAAIEPGQRVVARFPAHPELAVEGTVVRVSPVLEGAARVLPVWIEVENEGDRLRPGMLATVDVHVPQSLGDTGPIATLK